MTIQKDAITRAIKLLDAAGAEYAIRHDGETVGALVVLPTRKTKPFKRLHNFSADLGYIPKITKAQQGDSIEWKELPSAAYAKAFTDSLSSMAYRKWGKGNFIIKQVDNSVSILRI